ncbi:LOW QUALITY PROTEIN: hypothetical protein SSIG_07303, partial [Streptomyces filamentosus NRRL 11379]
MGHQAGPQQARHGGQAAGEAPCGGNRRGPLDRHRRPGHRPPARRPRPRAHRGAGHGRRHGPGAALNAGTGPGSFAADGLPGAGHPAGGHSEAGDTGAVNTGAVVADRFERFTWRDTYEQSAGLRELAEALEAYHDHATDLLTDVFLAAYKAGPRLREPAQMRPSRLVNHQLLTQVMASPDFAELRRETVGDPYAAAMAVLAQSAALRRMLECSRGAREQGERAEEALRTA